MLIFNENGHKITLISTKNRTIEPISVYKGRYIYYDYKTIDGIQNLDKNNPISFFILILKTNISVDDNQLVVKGQGLDKYVKLSQLLLKQHEYIILIGYGENVQNAISVYNILMENQISNLKNIKTLKNGL